MSSCEVCGSSDLQRKHSKIGTIVECNRCCSSFAIYYRRDGQAFDYPKSWGRCLSFYLEPEGFEKLPNGEGDRWMIFTEGYYVFIAANGTLRRSRIASEKFPTQRPAKVPAEVEEYHYWVVDLLFAARRPRKTPTKARRTNGSS